MKKLKLFFVLMFACIALVGCSTNKLSDAYDEKELKTESENIIQMLCDEDYDKIVGKFGNKLADALTSSKLKEVWEPMAKKLGDFESFEKEAIVGKDNQATVVTVTKFKNGKSQFTITYDEDMKVTGFYIK